jgi:hypothetical protein
MQRELPHEPPRSPLDPPDSELGRDLCQLAAHRHAADAELARMAAELEDSEEWTGFRSAAHWLSVFAGFDHRTGYELIGVGQALKDLPALAAAFAAGRLSLDKVRSITQVATPADQGIWIDLALQASASQLARICRAYRRALEADAPERAELHLAKRGLWATWEDDGMLRVTARLTPEDGAKLLAAIDAALPRPDPQTPTEPVRDPAYDRWTAARADALVAIAEHALAGGPDGLSSAPNAGQVVVHVDVGVLTGEQPDGRCHLENGPSLSRATALKLGCEARIVAITERDGLPIDVGRATRVISPRLRRALESRDGGCRFPGCGAPARRADGHHIIPWALGGPTELDNLALQCGFHHTLVHEGAFRIVKEADGGLRFEDRWGRLIAPDPDLSGEARVLFERDAGKGIHCQTAAALDGGPIQFDYALSVIAAACDHVNSRASPPG